MRFFHTPSAWECVPRSSASHSRSRNCPRNKHSPCRKAGLPFHRNPGRILSHPLLWSTHARHRSNPQEKNNIVIPEFSAWLTLVLEQCRAENIRNLPRQRAPTPLFPERRPREACSMPISGCHDLPLATFNLPSRNNLQNKPNSAATMSLPCSRFATAQPQRQWDAPPGGHDSPLERMRSAASQDTARRRG